MSRQLPAMTLAELTVELGSRARAVETLRWLFSQRPMPTGLPELIPEVSHRV